MDIKRIGGKPIGTEQGGPSIGSRSGPSSRTQFSSTGLGGRGQSAQQAVAQRQPRTDIFYSQAPLAQNPYGQSFMQMPTAQTSLPTPPQSPVLNQPPNHNRLQQNHYQPQHFPQPGYQHQVPNQNYQHQIPNQNYQHQIPNQNYQHQMPQQNYQHQMPQHYQHQMPQHYQHQVPQHYQHQVPQHYQHQAPQSPGLNSYQMHNQQPQYNNQQPQYNLQQQTPPQSPVLGPRPSYNQQVNYNQPQQYNPQPQSPTQHTHAQYPPQHTHRPSTYQRPIRNDSAGQDGFKQHIRPSESENYTVKLTKNSTAELSGAGRIGGKNFDLTLTSADVARYKKDVNGDPSKMNLKSFLEHCAQNGNGRAEVKWGNFEPMPFSHAVEGHDDFTLATSKELENNFQRLADLSYFKPK